MNALRLAVGTLTVLPVRAPATVDRATAGRAMALAPLVGLLLAVPCLLLLWLLPDRRPLLAAALVVTLLALLTRALHLDGLADTADGLGSGKPAEAALAVMRRGDVGPFGVVTLVLALLLQVVSLTELLVRGQAVGLVPALVVSRLMLPLACLRGIPSAREDGLGSAVAGSVGPGLLAVSASVPALLVAGYVGLGVSVPLTLTGAILSAALALGAGLLLCRRCVRRLGGITGDVLGAGVEVTFTVALVVLALS